MFFHRSSQLLAVGAALAVGLAGASAQVPVAKPVAPGDKPTPVPVAVKPAEPTDIKTFAFASDAELADMTQLFGGLFAKLAPKPPAAVPVGTPAPAPQAVKAPKFTVSARTKTVIVRGSKAELDQAEAIVKLIQGAATDPKGPQLAKLKTARVDEVVAALTALELEGRVLALRGSNSLVMLPGFEADAEQVKKVIEAFEKVELKPTTKTPVKPGVDD